jgi:hypothetical protein
MGAPWHGPKKAVPCQPNVQTGFLRAAVPPLLSCTNQFCWLSLSRLPLPPLSGHFDVCALRIAPSMKQCDYMTSKINARWSVPLGSKARIRRVPQTWTEVAQRLVTHGNP